MVSYLAWVSFAAVRNVAMIYARSGKILDHRVRQAYSTGNENA